MINVSSGYILNNVELRHRLSLGASLKGVGVIPVIDNREEVNIC